MTQDTRTLVVILQPDVLEALVRLAQEEQRGRGAQAAVIIQRELERQGFLLPDVDQQPNATLEGEDNSTDKTSSPRRSANMISLLKTPEFQEAWKLSELGVR